VIRPDPPHASFALPWDDPTAPDPVVALASARAELGDTFAVLSGDRPTLFVFGPAAVAALYALPEATASKGLADYRMLLRKLPEELFAGRRTFAHDLFGARDVDTYLAHLDVAVERQLEELGAEGRFDVFGLARRVGHRLALGCWMGPAATEPPLLDRLIAAMDVLDGSESFVHPERMAAIAASGKRDERAALGAVHDVVGLLLDPETPAASPGFLGEIAARWVDVAGEDRVTGVTGDVVLLHIATMTNLIAALGWSLGELVLHPDDLDRVRAGDGAFLERAALEAIRLGQHSIITREVVQPCVVDTGNGRYELDPGAHLATMVPLTNRSAAPGLDRYDPDRWDGRRLRDEGALAAPELVTTFGHGPHRCPAQRFSLRAITLAVQRLVDRYDLVAEFDGLRAQPGQIGGVARAADACPVAYRTRVATR
jgi:cytochrome P450